VELLNIVSLRLSQGLNSPFHVFSLAQAERGQFLPMFRLEPYRITHRENDAVTVANIPDELRANADRSGDLRAVVFSSQSQVKRGLFLFSGGSHLAVGVVLLAANIHSRCLKWIGIDLFRR